MPPARGLSGVAVAVVVDHEVAGDGLGGIDADLQVGAADGPARLQGGVDGQAGDVGQQQQGVVEPGLADGLAAVQRGQGVVQQPVVDAATVVELDLVVLRFQHFDAHDAGLDGLGRDVGPRQRIAVVVVIGGDAVGQFAQLRQGDAFAFAVRDQRVQGWGVDLGVAGDLDGLDLERRALGQLAGALALDGQAGAGRRRRRRRDRLDLLQHGAGIRGATTGRVPVRVPCGARASRVASKGFLV